MAVEHWSEESRNLHCCEVSFGETDLSIGFGSEDFRGEMGFRFLAELLRESETAPMPTFILTMIATTRRR